MRNSVISLLILACACGNIIGQVKLDSALVDYYPFNGNANDESGHGYNGTVYGASLTLDRFGNPNSAYNFNGSNSYIVIPNNEIGNLYDFGTISFWFNAAAGNFDGGQHRVLEKDYWSWWMFIISGNIMYFTVCQDNRNAFPRIILTQEEMINKWNHVLVTKKLNAYDIYVNGDLKSSITTPFNHLTTSANMTFGRSNYWRSQYFNGIIDDIRVYNRALSQTEVQTLYQEFKRPPAPLIYMVSPREAIHDQTSFKMTIIGYPFYPETNIQLKRTGVSSILPASINFVDSTKLIATFNLQGAKAGDWDLETRNPDGLALSFPNALNILTILEMPLDQTIEIPLVAGRKFLAGFDVPIADHFYVTIQKVEQDWNCTAILKSQAQTVSSRSGGGDWLMDIAHASGTYILEINPSQNSSIIIRAGASLPQLKLDEMLVRKIYHNDGYDWLQMEVPEDILSLHFTVETVGNISDLDVWRDSLGSNEHWHARQSFNPPVRLTIDNPGSGTYYLRVYDHGVITGSQVRDYSIYATLELAPHLAHDATAIEIFAPDTVVQLHSTIIPKALIKNTGLNQVTIPVQYRIGTVYNETAEITLASGESGTLSFPAWLADELGFFHVQCQTMLTNDMKVENDSTKSIVVVLKDMNDPAIFYVAPDKVVNSGLATIEIHGQGFEPGMGTKLTRDGYQDIISSETTVVNSGMLVTSFDVNSEQLGSWNVVVTNQNGQALVLQNGFVIGEAFVNLWVEIVGRSQIRIGRESTYKISYGNSGNTSTSDRVLLIIFPSWLEYRIDEKLFPSTNDFDWNSIPAGVALNSQKTAIPIWVPNLNINEKDNFNLIIKTPINISSRINKISTNSAQEQINIQVLSLRPSMQEYPELEQQYERIRDDLGLNQLPKNLPTLWKYVKDRFWTYGLPGLCLGAILIGLISLWFGVPVGVASTIVTILFTALAAFDWAASPWPEKLPIENESEVNSNLVNSVDPNEKIGSQGVGIHRSISSSQLTQFLIYFENLENATAAAQEVELLDTLDTDLDWDAFAFDDVQIGDTTIIVSNLGNAFTKIVSWNDTTEVRISGTFDPAKGIARWHFRGTDTRTGDFGDFLPPNQASPEGEGHVGFIIKPKPSLLSGIQIKNRASIVFDVNPAMVTNEVFNTIDADAPTSRVLALNTTQTSNEFEVRWSGSDVGSGIKDYIVFVAENGGPYSVWLASTIDTCATFTGLAGTKYVFFSIARDGVGNREAAPIFPDATTEVLTSIDEAIEELPVEFALMQNYPNPFNPSTTIRFDVPRLSHVKIKIYDILGREVVTLVDRNFEAGRFTETWNGRNNNEQQVASGLYFMRMHADKFLKVRKLILIR